MKHLSLEDRFVANFEIRLRYHPSDFDQEEATKWLRAALTTYKSALIGEIEGKIKQSKIPGYSANTDAAKWVNAAKDEDLRILSDLRGVVTPKRIRP